MKRSNSLAAVNSLRARFDHRRNRMTVSVLAILVLISCATLAFVVRAYNRASPNTNKPAAISRMTTAAQVTQMPQGMFYSRLSVQPEANVMRRRLGQRFLSTGREVSSLTGTMIIGKEQHTINLRRNQEEDGENISVALDDGQTSLTWNQIDGPQVLSSSTTSDVLFLIERLALDSPDQFIMAQLRGASYYVIARNVMPEESDPESYEGPVWDVIRVGEPESTPQIRSRSPWHLYYINSSTGLIERVISQDLEGVIVAELSGWVSQGGEMVPSRISWKRDGQLVMEFNASNVAFSSNH